MRVADLRTSLVDAFAALPINFTPRPIADVLPPHAWIVAIEAAPVTFSDTGHDVTVTIAVAVSGSDNDGAVALVDSLIDDNVIADALRTLGSVARYTDIGGTLTVNGDYIGFLFELDVTA